MSEELKPSDIGMPDSDPVEAARASIQAKLQRIVKMATDIRMKYSPEELRADRAVNIAIAAGDPVTPPMLDAFGKTKANLAAHAAALKAAARECQREYDHITDDLGLEIGKLRYTSFGLPCRLDTTTRQDIWD